MLNVPVGAVSITVQLNPQAPPTELVVKWGQVSCCCLPVDGVYQLRVTCRCRTTTALSSYRLSSAPAALQWRQWHTQRSSELLPHAHHAPLRRQHAALHPLQQYHLCPLQHLYHLCPLQHLYHLTLRAGLPCSCRRCLLSSSPTDSPRYVFIDILVYNCNPIIPSSVVNTHPVVQRWLLLRDGCQASMALKHFWRGERTSA